MQYRLLHVPDNFQLPAEYRLAVLLSVEQKFQIVETLYAYMMKIMQQRPASLAWVKIHQRAAVLQAHQISTGGAFVSFAQISDSAAPQKLINFPLIFQHIIPDTVPVIFKNTDINIAVLSYLNSQKQFKRESAAKRPGRIQLFQKIFVSSSNLSQPFPHQKFDSYKKQDIISDVLLVLWSG